MLRSMPSGNQGYTSSVQLDECTILTVSYGKVDGTTAIIGTRWTLP